MRVNLLVPYSERNEAKQLGAKWDAARKTWYVIDVEKLEPFIKWMPAHLKRPHKVLQAK